MPTWSLTQSQREFRTSREETFQQLPRIKLNKTPLISTNWARKTLVKHHNQDFKARETWEFNHPLKLALKYHPRETTTKVRYQDKETIHPQELYLENRTSDNHRQAEKEATRGHQSTQEVLMFMLIKTSCSTLNRNIKLQVTKKTPLQTFHRDHKWEGIKLLAIHVTIIIMVSISHTLHKQA